MTLLINSLETHHAIHVFEQAHLPIRTVVGQWARELGRDPQHPAFARFPGPRNSPGNVTTAHIGKVCGYLWGGSRTEQHKFPVFCSIAEGVKEYIWYFNNLIYYRKIAAEAGGNWIKACNLIEASPWSSDHYGRTLDATARACQLSLGQVHVDLAQVRSATGPTTAIVGQYGRGKYLAISATVGNWFRVRYGSGNGAMGYIHSSQFGRVNV